MINQHLLIKSFILNYDGEIQKVVSDIIYPHKFYYQVIQLLELVYLVMYLLVNFTKTLYNHLPYEINFNLGLQTILVKRLKNRNVPNSNGKF